MPRITVDELHSRFEDEDPPIVLDVRSRSPYQRDAGSISGSVRVLLEDVAEWDAAEREKKLAVVYCT